tara:strand:- start:36299 stop:37939 length:1641 start_codon:yes stop_codon:yes gene_type:complete
VATADGDDVPRILFLNRCKDGCVLTPGPDNAIENVSQIVPGPVSIAPFPYGDDVWNEVVTCVRDQYSRFNINVTDQDPGTLPHFESIIAGDANDVAPGAGGVAPFSCGVLPNSINFTFAETLGGNAQNLCEVAAQESGHVMGLEHIFLCEDPMTYLTGCGPKTFQDVTTDCGEFQAQACQCGDQQNSVQHLLSIFGPGGQEPTAEITIIEVRESPASSNGDGVLEPGESVQVSLSLANRGNALAENIKFKLSAGSNLGLSTMEPFSLEGGNTINVDLDVTVKPEACGKDVEFTVTSQANGGSWSDEASVSVGILAEDFTTNSTEMQSWTANVDSTPAQGAWEYGVPQYATFGGRVLQPAGGGAGATSSAWITGLQGEWNETAVVGETALESAPLALGDWNKISGITYRLWYFAFDRIDGGLEPSQETHLVVELSSNNGKSWKQIDSIDTGELYRWEPRSVEFSPLTSSDEVKLRFKVSNSGSVDDRLIVVGVDEVTLVGGELLCTPVDSSGCGCSSTEPQPANWLLLGLLALYMRRRSKRSRAACN